MFHHTSAGEWSVVLDALEYSGWLGDKIGKMIELLTWRDRFDRWILETVDWNGLNMKKTTLYALNSKSLFSQQSYFLFC